MFLEIMHKGGPISPLNVNSTEQEMQKKKKKTLISFFTSLNNFATNIK